MNIVFVASESTPFVKTGGLADVIGSLPQALRKEGNVIDVFLPKYKAIPEEYKQRMESVYRGEISLGWRKQYCGVDTLHLDGINYYFIDNEYYFGRDNIYGYSDDLDEAERFTFFSKAVLEMIPKVIEKVDIIHVHDWQTAMVPVYMEAQYKKEAFYENVKTMFTIHNLKYQGIFSSHLLGDVVELGPEYFHPEALEFHGCINFMKGALVYADIITTVSDAYAKEIQYPFFGEGLDGLLRKRHNDLYGVINGIDTVSYDPASDVSLIEQYRDWSGKYVNKKVLQQLVGLPERQVPMVAMITRLVEQKGLDLVVRVLDELLQDDIQVVILGTGEPKYEQLLSEIASRYSEKFSLQLKFDEAMSRQIYAGADLFLMPSLFEPCGLSQLISFRYQTVPIVRETGGLKDTVQPFNEYTGEGNGFSFMNYNAHDMLHTIRRAISFYQDPQQWEKIVRNGTVHDFSWKQSAKKYRTLYHQLCLREEAVTT
ncbi:glycogen synthase GlgA [Aquibacillus albus]|uniref:Glycogen synthase n=1 Tax=Aquibacillus albus TaxID=1168171 RepID=A0ABS2N5F8_9BACI|nr:glycogen synthase GlgA [Aquibacillus albus]MBM7573370.1 starch synthase [Aquibacillus albus]